ncbi:hypothetical protein C8Q80DRAFT_701525 [Daedaleopsis nitida]|nr:hypothetical protein C8Q80DRAFT_701525 [Daedaleopsis nitida]
MAIGFGSHMANTPMVIVWQGPDGNTILSQRQASSLVEPQPVTDPPRLARTPHRVNPTSNVSSILAFDMPRTNDTVQPLIWAFGITTPDASPTATIEQHLDAGTFSLNLTKELVIASNVLSSSVSSPSSSTGSSTATSGSPLLSQSSTPSASAARTSRTSGLLVAHAVLSAAGFLIVLPLGTLLARWSRVFTPKWFTAHWFINVVLGIPLICLGWALGPLAVAQQSGEHVVTAHQICGVVLFVLYIIEVALGTLVHLRRPKQGPSHPPRNVIHVVVGLAVFGLSIYETINGVNRDPSVTGVSQSVVVAICIGWAAVSSLAFHLSMPDPPAFLGGTLSNLSQSPSLISLDRCSLARTASGCSSSGDSSHRSA